jgi:hypothetical protein
MDLTQSTWMIRELGQPVSALHIGDDYSITAGGWDGKLSHWDSEGKHIWSVDCMDRIESILQVNASFIVTSGLHIVCIENGEQIWSHALEGSADLIAFHSGNIVATSSVYDIEHGDFMEGAIWTFSQSGDLEAVDRIDEKPWFLSAREELVIGLGRPRCGVLLDGEHASLGIDSPITCGLELDNIVFLGHANGVICDSTGNEISRDENGIESIISYEDGFVTALENGNLIFRRMDKKVEWSVKKDQITTQTSAFSYHWAGNWNGLEGLIEVRDISGELIVSSSVSRPRVSTSWQNRVGFGLDDGKIMVWEKELFERRKGQEFSVQNEQKSALAERLRSLRK